MPPQPQPPLATTRALREASINLRKAVEWQRKVNERQCQGQQKAVPRPTEGSAKANLRGHGVRTEPGPPEYRGRLEEADHAALDRLARRRVLQHAIVSQNQRAFGPPFSPHSLLHGGHQRCNGAGGFTQADNRLARLPIRSESKVRAFHPRSALRFHPGRGQCVSDVRQGSRGGRMPSASSGQTGPARSRTS